ncbi:MAG: serine hydrolase domain-containing protein [Flavobacteriales bacterium]
MKKIILKVLGTLVVIICLAALVAVITGNGYLIKGVSCTYLRGHSTAHIYDLSYFDAREVANATAQPWTENEKLGAISLNAEEEAIHQQYRSAAFLVIENDEVLFEKYWGEHNEEAISNSFSMVKSVTALMIGIAHDEGLINSLDDPACDYIPELCNASEKNKAITVRDLLTMTSTINFDEHYGDPFGFMARATYGSDLKEVTYDEQFVAQKEPGTEWEYLGGNTLLLGFIVENVTGKTLSQYLSEKLWKPMGAEAPAQWALDSEGGHEKSYCCFHARARDYARFGKLLLQRGNWNGQQLVSQQFIDEMISPITAPDNKGVEADHYGYQIWLDNQNGEEIVNYRGMLGQYITVIPARDLIIVRLGHARGERDNHCPSDLKEWIRMGLRISQEG